MENADVEVIREGKIIAVLGSREHEYALDQMGLTMNSTDSEVLAAMEPVFEEEGIALDNLTETYIVKRQEDSGNVFIFPKSTAGIGYDKGRAPDLEYGKAKKGVQYIIVDQEGDWFQVYTSEDELQKEIKSLTGDGSLGSGVEIYKVVETYKIDVQLKKIEEPPAVVL